MNYYNVEQNSQEWFDLKRGKFSASMFADLFMKDSTKGYWDALYKVVYERISGETPETYQNQAMQRGLELEPIAKEWYELKTFNKVNNLAIYMIFTLLSLPNCRVQLDRQHAFGFSAAAAPEEFGGMPNFCSQSQTIFIDQEMWFLPTTNAKMDPR